MNHRRHEKYWQRYALPSEQIVHYFGVSRAYIFVFWFIPFLLFSFFTWYLTKYNDFLSLLLGLVSICALIPAIYLTYFVQYAITNRRIMTREGFLHKKFVTAGLQQVTDVTVKESFLERILTHTGVIGINTAGSNYVEVYFRHVARPIQLRKDIFHHQQIMRQQEQAPVPSATSESWDKSY